MRCHSWLIFLFSVILLFHQLINQWSVNGSISACLCSKFMGRSAAQSHHISDGGHTSDTSAHSLLLSHPITAPQTAHACPVPTSRNTAAAGKPIHYPRLTSLRPEYSQRLLPRLFQLSALILLYVDQICSWGSVNGSAQIPEKATWGCLSLSGTESGEGQTSLPDRNGTESPT